MLTQKKPWLQHAMMKTHLWHPFPFALSDSPGGHPKVFLDEVAGDGQRQQGEEEDGGHVADDTQCGHTQQGGTGEALQRGRDVLVDCVCVSGKPVEDAAERSRLKQPGRMKREKKMMTCVSIASKLHDDSNKTDLSAQTIFQLLYFTTLYFS